MKFEVHWSDSVGTAVCFSTLCLAIASAVGFVAWGSAAKQTECHKAQAAAFASSNPEIAAKAPICHD